MTSLQKRAYYYSNKIIPIMEELREIADEIEFYLGEEYKPFPSYEDLLFSVQ